LNHGGDDALFGCAAPAGGWKRFLRPPVERLWSATRTNDGFRVDETPAQTTRQAFLGVRGCDLAAMDVLQRAILSDDRADPAQEDEADAADRPLIIAVNCVRSTKSCFCRSMGTGPRVGRGADIVLTELPDGSAGAPWRLLAEAPSPAGEALLVPLEAPIADPAAIERADALIEAAGQSQTRQMIPDVQHILSRNLEHPVWDEIAGRCLGCGNCTMACPTCFCTTIEDTTDLSGGRAERWRKWDSCFTLDFSYIHGGWIRQSLSSRYRQWMTHKLCHWWEQFQRSGCVGCGRCITWCPVGIDITHEARRIRDSGGATG
jgi:ferredoxin